MVEEEFDVYIEDEDGNVVIDTKIKTMSNGFFDLWLPREKEYQIKIKNGGKMAESELSTFEDSATCITTIQLM